MKHTIKIIFNFILALISLNISAQNKNTPWTISLNTNGVDFFEEELLSFAELGNINYKFIPSKLVFARHIVGNFSGRISGSFNTISEIGWAPAEDQSFSADIKGLQYYATDAAIAYSFRNLISKEEDFLLDPQLSIGGGAFWLEKSKAYYNANVGIDLDFWFSKKFALNVGTMYKGVLSELGQNYDNHVYNAESTDGISTVPFQTSHLHHHVGIKFQFGGRDTDGDGVPDSKDACPSVFGLKKLNGCPDTDGDGITDKEDSCPKIAGLAEFDGCPDTDGDGITDELDMCPKIAGLINLNGCPDTDGDGVIDSKDKCPNEAGTKSNDGCPIADADNDGVPDEEDVCPEEAGAPTNFGCPESRNIPKEITEKLTKYKKSILFDSGKFNLRAKSEKVLKDIISIIKEYPTAKFFIEGNTDSSDTEARNKILSQDRANTVEEYFVKNGLSKKRFTTVPNGEEKPIATNGTRYGRQLNRRTEVKLNDTEKK